MAKYKALQVCHTSELGRIYPAIIHNKKKIWNGDVVELSEAEAKAFGPKHFKKMPASAKLQRWVTDGQKKKSGKTMSTADVPDADDDGDE